MRIQVKYAFCLLCAALGLKISNDVEAQGRYRLIDLGAGQASYAAAVNDRLEVVGAQQIWDSTGSYYRPFHFSGGQTIFLEGTGTARDINNSGTIVGSIYDAPHRFGVAAIWRRGQLSFIANSLNPLLTTLGTPGGLAQTDYASVIYAVNDREQMIGNARYQSQGAYFDIGFSYANENPSLLNSASNSSVIAWSLSELGVVAITDGGSPFLHGTDRRAIELPAGNYTVRDTIAQNNFGDIAINLSTPDGPTVAFFDGQRWTFLPCQAGGATVRALNNRREIVGVCGGAGVLWKGGLRYDLASLVRTCMRDNTETPCDSSLKITNVADINQSGVIVGKAEIGEAGTDTYGHFAYMLVPEDLTVVNSFPPPAFSPEAEKARRLLQRLIRRLETAERNAAISGTKTEAREVSARASALRIIVKLQKLSKRYPGQLAAYYPNLHTQTLRKVGRAVANKKYRGALKLILQG